VEEAHGALPEVCNTRQPEPAKWEDAGYLVSSVMRREGFPRNQDIELYRTSIGGIVTAMATVRTMVAASRRVGSAL